jgi:periplasmic protein TonB
MERSGLRSHLSGSVPISIALHLVALLLFVVIPLTAKMILPDPASDLPEYMPTAPMPPPPPVTPAPSRPSPSPVPAQTSDPSIPPRTAPDTIEPETASPGTGTDPSAIPSIEGVSDGLGLVIGGAPVAMQAPEPPRPSGPIRVADLPVTPRKISDARPIYPEFARSARKEGTVILEAVLDTTGRVTQLRVIKSEPLLDLAAVDAVKQWRYTPSLYGGRPVSVLMTITVRFTLQ